MDCARLFPDHNPISNVFLSSIRVVLKSFIVLTRQRINSSVVYEQIGRHKEIPSDQRGCLDFE